MTAFLRRHTTRFWLDAGLHHEYGGFMPQTRFDTFWFDRQVQILLKTRANKTFSGAEIHVYYTFR